MRQMHCNACMKRPVFSDQPLREGTYELLAANHATGEPAEWVRVIHGIARPPRPATRMMYINGDPLPLPLDAYECDNCNVAIYPGDVASCVTMWQPPRQPEPPRWEEAYLTRSELPPSTNAVDPSVTSTRKPSTRAKTSSS